MVFGLMDGKLRREHVQNHGWMTSVTGVGVTYRHTRSSATAKLFSNAIMTYSYIYHLVKV